MAGASADLKRSLIYRMRRMNLGVCPDGRRQGSEPAPPPLRTTGPSRRVFRCASPAVRNDHAPQPRSFGSSTPAPAIARPRFHPPGVTPHSPAGDEACPLGSSPFSRSANGEGDRRRRRWWRGSGVDTPPSTAPRLPPPHLCCAKNGEDLRECISSKLPALMCGYERRVGLNPSPRRVRRGWRCRDPRAPRPRSRASGRPARPPAPARRWH